MMGEILNAIKINLSDEAFTAGDVSDITGINDKVCSMVLKKYAIAEELSCFLIREVPHFLYRTKEEIREAKIDVNLIIDKHNLKQEKWIIN